jgi:hypothetical protein
VSHVDVVGAGPAREAGAGCVAEVVPVDGHRFAAAVLLGAPPAVDANSCHGWV